MPMLTRRGFVVDLTLGAAAASLTPLAARAETAAEFPSRPIHIVVPYPAGGTTDQLARVLAQPLQDRLGQAVVVENKPGASGTLGADYVARARGDGYTLLFGNSGPNATVSLMRQLPYDIHKDFRPLSAVVTVPLILSVSADSPFKTLKEFIAYAKSQGTKLNYGSTGVGGSSHLASEYFNDLAGTQIQHIPYNGGAPMLSAFAGGQIQMAFLTGLDGAVMVAAKKVRYLAVGSPQRTDVLPGLPAISEDVPGFSAVVWFGLLGPKGLPDDIANKLSIAIADVVHTPAVRKFFIDRNVEPKGSTPQELAQIIDGELAQWGPLIKKNHITI